VTASAGVVQRRTSGVVPLVQQHFQRSLIVRLQFVKFNFTENQLNANTASIGSKIHAT